MVRTFALGYLPLILPWRKIARLFVVWTNRLVAAYVSSLRRSILVDASHREPINPLYDGTTIQYRPFPLTMDMIALFLDGHPELRALLECFVSESALDGAMTPYAAPETRECGGFFGLGCKIYTIECHLDRCLFDVCARFRKEEFYGLLRDQFRSNYATVRLVHRVCLEAFEMRKEPEEVLARLANVYASLYKYMLNVIYAWLMLMDERKLRTLLNQLVENARTVADQLPELVQRFRQDLAALDSGNRSGGGSGGGGGGGGSGDDIGTGGGGGGRGDNIETVLADEEEVEEDDDDGRVAVGRNHGASAGPVAKRKRNGSSGGGRRDWG